jgi:hypothetical protein
MLADAGERDVDASALCALCGKPRELRNSHLIPDFVIRWLRDTSASGRFLGGPRPQAPIQALPTMKLLCGECEDRFSQGERLFAPRLFYPFQEGRRRFRYGEWLLQFAVSLAWRCLTMFDDVAAARWPQQVAAVQRAHEHWRDFLLGRSTQVKPYRHNLLFTPAGWNLTHPFRRASSGTSLALPTLPR